MTDHLVTIRRDCCASSFTARTEARAIELHADYHAEREARALLRCLGATAVTVRHERRLSDGTLVVDAEHTAR